MTSLSLSLKNVEESFSYYYYPSCRSWTYVKLDSLIFCFCFSPSLLFFRNDISKVLDVWCHRSAFLCPPTESLWSIFISWVCWTSEAGGGSTTVLKLFKVFELFIQDLGIIMERVEFLWKNVQRIVDKKCKHCIVYINVKKADLLL